MPVFAGCPGLHGMCAGALDQLVAFGAGDGAGDGSHEHAPAGSGDMVDVVDFEADAGLMAVVHARSAYGPGNTMLARASTVLQGPIVAWRCVEDDFVLSGSCGPVVQPNPPGWVHIRLRFAGGAAAGHPASR